MLKHKAARIAWRLRSGPARLRLLAACSGLLLIAFGFLGGSPEYFRNFMHQGQRGAVTVTRSGCYRTCHVRGFYRSDDGSTDLADVEIKDIGPVRVGTVHAAWDAALPPHSARRVFAQQGWRSGLVLLIVMGLPTVYLGWWMRYERRRARGPASLPNELQHEKAHPVDILDVRPASDDRKPFSPYFVATCTNHGCQWISDVVERSDPAEAERVVRELAASHSSNILGTRRPVG